MSIWFTVANVFADKVDFQARMSSFLSSVPLHSSLGIHWGVLGDGSLFAWTIYINKKLLFPYAWVVQVWKFIFAFSFKSANFLQWWTQSFPACTFALTLRDHIRSVAFTWILMTVLDNHCRELTAVKRGLERLWLIQLLWRKVTA